MFGDGTTATFSSGTMPAVVIKSIGEWNRTTVTEDATPLSQAARTYSKMCFGNRIKHDPITIDYFFSGTTLGTLDIPLAVQQTLTINYPDGSQLSGIGRIVGAGGGAMVNDEVSMGTIQWQFAGGSSAPVYAA